jgi:long-chain acyl-CoA synthetase
MSDLGFWSFAQREPESLGLAAPDGREWTRGELLASCNQIVHGLRALGLKHGDCVAAVLPNGVEMIELYLAVAQAGFYLTPIIHHLTAPEIAYIVGDCGAKAFVGAERFTAACSAAAAELEFPADARLAVGGVPGFRDFQE